MKQLTQAIFKNAPDWVMSAAVDEDGSVYWYNAYSYQLVIDRLEGSHRVNAYEEDLPNYPEYFNEFEFVDDDYDTSDWQNSAIGRRCI